MTNEVEHPFVFLLTTCMSSFVMYITISFIFFYLFLVHSVLWTLLIYLDLIFFLFYSFPFHSQNVIF